MLIVRTPFMKSATVQHFTSSDGIMEQ